MYSSQLSEWKKLNNKGYTYIIFWIHCYILLIKLNNLENTLNILYSMENTHSNFNASTFSKKNTYNQTILIKKKKNNNNKFLSSHGRPY